MSEEEYREKRARGRIRIEDLAAVLGEDLQGSADEWVCPLASRFELRLAMLKSPLRSGPVEELRWFVAETDALTRIRPGAAPTCASDSSTRRVTG